MFRKTIDPRFAAIATLCTLVGIQWFYWRNLVYEPPTRGAGGPPPPGGPPPQIALLGLESFVIENWIGDEPGYRDGKCWEARFSGPNALASLPNGDLVVADSRNHCLRRVSPLGTVSTLAGGAFVASGGDRLGRAEEAGLRHPSGVAANSDGTVYLSDTGNHRLCVLKDGVLKLLAGGQAGNADGAGAAARFNSPGPCAFDRSGRLWVLDGGNRKLRAVTREGVVTSPPAIPPEIRRNLGEILATTPANIWASGDGETAPQRSTHQVLRVGASGWAGSTRIFGDIARNVILAQPPGREPFILAGRVNPSGDPTGETDGPGYRASFATPAAVLARPDGAVYIADYDSSRLRRGRIPPELLR